MTSGAKTHELVVAVLHLLPQPVEPQVIDRAVRDALGANVSAPHQQGVHANVSDGDSGGRHG